MKTVRPMPESVEDMLNREFERFEGEHGGYSKEELEAKLSSLEKRLNELWTELREMVLEDKD
jgi:hypothetical protein